MQNQVDPEQLTSMVLDMDVLRQVIVNPADKPVILNGAEEGEQQPVKEDKAAGIKSALFIIYLIGVLIAAAAFSQIEPLLCVSVIGSFFLFVGVAAVLQQGITSDNFMLAVVPTAGFLMTALPIVVVYGKNHPENAILDAASALDIVLAALAFFGLFLTVAAPLAHFKKTARCKMTVPATCIYRLMRFSRSKTAGGRSRTVGHYSPIWQYEVNGTIYITNEQVFSSDSPEIGGVREIRYDPQCPSYIYRPIAAGVIAPLICGIAFLVMSLIALYFHLHG